MTTAAGLVANAARIARVADQFGVAIAVSVSAYGRVMVLLDADSADDVDRLGDALALPRPGRVFGDGHPMYERRGPVDSLDVAICCGAPAVLAAAAVIVEAAREAAS